MFRLYQIPDTANDKSVITLVRQIQEDLSGVEGIIIPYVCKCGDCYQEVHDLIANLLNDHKMENHEWPPVGTTYGLLGYSPCNCVLSRRHSEMFIDYWINPVIQRGEYLYLWGARYWKNGKPYYGDRPYPPFPAVTPSLLREICK